MMSLAEIIFNIIIWSLGVILVITFFKSPGQIISLTFRSIFKIDLFRDFGNQGEELKHVAYKAQKKVYFDFEKSSKTIILDSADFDIPAEISEALETLSEQFFENKIEIENEEQYKIVKLENGIGFYAFHFLIEWLLMKSKDSLGIIESKEVNYVIFKDPSSLNNLIGLTNTNEKIFVDLFINHEDEEFLGVDASIDLDKEKLKARLPKSVINI